MFLRFIALINIVQIQALNSRYGNNIIQGVQTGTSNLCNEQITCPLSYQTTNKTDQRFLEYVVEFDESFTQTPAFSSHIIQYDDINSFSYARIYLHQGICNLNNCTSKAESKLYNEIIFLSIQWIASTNDSIQLRQIKSWVIQQSYSLNTIQLNYQNQIEYQIFALLQQIDGRIILYNYSVITQQNITLGFMIKDDYAWLFQYSLICIDSRYIIKNQSIFLSNQTESFSEITLQSNSFSLVGLEQRQVQIDQPDQWQFKIDLQDGVHANFSSKNLSYTIFLKFQLIQIFLPEPKPMRQFNLNSTNLTGSSTADQNESTIQKNKTNFNDGKNSADIQTTSQVKFNKSNSGDKSQSSMQSKISKPKVKRNQSLAIQNNKTEKSNSSKYSWVTKNLNQSYNNLRIENKFSRFIIELIQPLSCLFSIINSPQLITGIFIINRYQPSIQYMFYRFITIVTLPVILPDSPYKNNSQVSIFFQWDISDIVIDSRDLRSYNFFGLQPFFILTLYTQVSFIFLATLSLILISLSNSPEKYQSTSNTLRFKLYSSIENNFLQMFLLIQICIIDYGRSQNFFHPYYVFSFLGSIFIILVMLYHNISAFMGIKSIQNKYPLNSLRSKQQEPLNTDQAIKLQQFHHFTKWQRFNKDLKFSIILQTLHRLITILIVFFMKGIYFAYVLLLILRVIYLVFKNFTRPYIYQSLFIWHSVIDTLWLSIFIVEYFKAIGIINSMNEEVIDVYLIFIIMVLDLGKLVISTAEYIYKSFKQRSIIPTHQKVQEDQQQQQKEQYVFFQEQPK